MISRNFLLVSLCLIASLVQSQVVTKAFVKQGNIYLKLANAGSRQLTFKGTDSQAILSGDKKYLVFVRTTKNLTKPAEDEYVIEERKIVVYTFATSAENVLVQGCKSDGSGSSAISYADSEEYPFTGLCNISNILLSPDGQRVYFETDAWTTSRAIHYCEIETGKIAFFVPGNLHTIRSNGDVTVGISNIDLDNGRYAQDWLFDKNGKEIKAIGKKVF